MGKYLLIEDFKFGLDTRKFMLNSPPGTLVTLTNGHITPGGEIEKRKAFTRTALPSNSFGLEVTDAGFVVFGSVAEGSLNASLPSGVTYQRLRHPVDTTAATGVETYAMTAVNHSSVFDGNAFVIATFGSSGTFAFYDGTVVYDFFAGRAASWLSTNQALANHLAALVNEYADYSSSSAFSSGGGYAVTLTAPSGITTEPTAEATTVGSGDVAAATTTTQVDGITGVSAQGQFTIVAGFDATGSAVSSVQVDSKELLPAAVEYITNNDTTAAAVKDAINGRQSAAVATTNRERTSNVAKLTVASHKFLVGDIVTVAGVTDGPVGVGADSYNGAATITAVTATTISYANTGDNETIQADTGGTITMVTRVYTASVDDNVVQIVASATGTAANDKAVAVTTTANAAGGVCIDQYSFRLSMISTAPTAAVPTITALFIDGVEVLGAAATGASIEAVIAAAAVKVIAYGGGTPVYTAAATGDTLYISRLSTNSNSRALTVMVVVDDQGGIITSGSFLSITTGPANLVLFGSAPAGATVMIGASAIYASVSGGVGPYTYEWTPDGVDFRLNSATDGHPRLEFLPDKTVRSPQLKITRTGSDAGGSVTYNKFSGSVSVKVTDSTTPRALTITATLPVSVQFYPYT